MHRIVIKQVDLWHHRSFLDITRCKIIHSTFHIKWIWTCLWEIWWCQSTWCTNPILFNHKWTISRIVSMIYLETFNLSRGSNIYNNWFIRLYSRTSLVSRRDLKTSMIALITLGVQMNTSTNNRNMIVKTV